MDTISMRKMKLHEMKDDRWQIRDKISQYKGLINLHQRDKSVGRFDSAVLRRKEKCMFTNLKKIISQKRAELDNAIFGDREKIRCALAENKRLQCAYQHLPVDRIVEHIYQDNFNQRKLLDLLRYRKLQRGNYLIELKLEVAELEDRINSHSEKVNVMSKIYEGRCQDAIFKKEAAIVVNETYKKIVRVMKKDSVYFDFILRYLHSDLLEQNRCMLDAIILGQTAVEYLDDRKYEFSRLEKAVRKNFIERLKVIKETRQRTEKAFRNVKYFVRRDSDIYLLPRSLYLHNYKIQNDINHLDGILKEMKDATSATNYEDLFFRITEQAKQNQRLKELREKFLDNYETLKNKVAHAEAKHQEMVNTMSDSVKEYKREKEQLQKRIQQQVDRAAKYSEKKSDVGRRMTEVKIHLQQIQQICNIVNAPKTRRKITMEKTTEVFEVYEDPKAIIEVLLRKLPKLVMSDTVQKSKERSDLARELFEKFTDRTTYKKCLDGATKVDYWLDDFEIEEASVPNRQDIKMISEEIVLANKPSDDDLILRPKRKY